MIDFKTPKGVNFFVIFLLYWVIFLKFDFIIDNKKVFRCNKAKNDQESENYKNARYAGFFFY